MVASISRDNVINFGEYIVHKIHQKMVEKAIPAPKRFLLQEDEDNQSRLKRFTNWSLNSHELAERFTNNFPQEIQIVVLNQTENIRQWISALRYEGIPNDIQNESAKLILHEVLKEPSFEALRARFGIEYIHDIAFHRPLKGLLSLLFIETYRSLSMEERAYLFRQLRKILPPVLANATKVQIVTEKIFQSLSSILDNKLTSSLLGTIAGLVTLVAARFFVNWKKVGQFFYKTLLPLTPLLKQLSLRLRPWKGPLILASIGLLAGTLGATFFFSPPNSLARRTMRKTWKIICKLRAENTSSSSIFAMSVLYKVVRLTVSQVTQHSGRILRIAKNALESKRLSQEQNLVYDLWERYTDEIIIKPDSLWMMTSL